MHTVHAGYSIIVNLKKDRVAVTRKLLADFNGDNNSASKICFDKSATTHFVTGTVLPEQKYCNETLPELLILATSFSGPADKHLDDLIEIAAPQLCQLFQNCEGFPDINSNSKGALKKFIKQHRHWDAFYSGMQYLTKEQVLRENKLRTLIEDFIDKNRNDKFIHETKSQNIRKQIQDYVKNQPGFEWTTKITKKTFIDFIVLYWSLFLVGIIAIGLIGCFVAAFFSTSILFKAGAGILVAIAVIVIFLFLSIRLYETQEKKTDVASRPPDADVKKISNAQVFPVLNTMSVSGGLKKGIFRRLFFMIALKAVVMLRGYVTIPSVYTARWMSINNGKRLVFLSNFLNLSESYVRDFIDNKSSAKQINLLFGQGTGYPITKWVLGDGAIDDPTAFIYEVMTNHRFTDLWYCPYQQLSIQNIRTNRKIALGLYGNLSEDDSIKWLQLF